MYRLFGDIGWRFNVLFMLILYMIIIMEVKGVDVITTIAGTGSASFSGDNGQATAAALYMSSGVTVDASGNFMLLIFLVNFVMYSLITPKAIYTSLIILIIESAK